MDIRSKVKSAASRFFFVTDFFVTKVFFVADFFFVTQRSFVTDTIVPVPIPCVPSFLWKPACFSFDRRCGRGVRRRRRMGFGVVGNHWWQGQNAFSEKQIGELLRLVGQGTGADEWAGVCF